LSYYPIRKLAVVLYMDQEVYISYLIITVINWSTIG